MKWNGWRIHDFSLVRRENERRLIKFEIDSLASFSETITITTLLYFFISFMITSHGAYLQKKKKKRKQEILMLAILAFETLFACLRTFNSYAF